MYLDHFGLNEPPFRITPHTDFFFGGANRGATLEGLLYAITNDEGIVKVTGEVGSGKTMLCRVLMERLPKNVETIYLANPSLGRDEILFAVADELKVSYEQDRPSRLMRSLLDHLISLYADGRRVVVLIDEAHAMPRETLEEIRLLSNLESNRHKLLQIVLFGQPELDAQLNTSSLRQLLERITQSFRLEPLVRVDIEKYIDFRMRAAGYRGPNVFSANAVRLIAEASQGLTRRINILADKSLLAAFAEGLHAVTVKEARRAIRDSEFYRARRDWRPAALTAGGIFGGLLLGLGAHFMLLDSPAPTSHSSGLTQQIQIKSTGPMQAPALAQQSPELPQGAGVAGAGAASPQPPEGMRGSPGSAPPARVREVPASQPSPALAAAPDRNASTHASGTSLLIQPQPPVRGKAASERFSATQEWLKATPGNYYSIQLLTARESELGRLENFLQRGFGLASREEFHVYSVKIDGVQCYRVAFGTYATVGETVNAMRDLPGFLAVQRPYYRTVERMRSQNGQ